MRAKGGYENVEFRKGKIEELPIEDESVDVIISNCVINLSPEKDRVFREAFRVLKPGGRMMISDIVLEKELPQEVADKMEAWVACVGGAILRDAYLQTVKDAGFSEIRVDGESTFGTAMAPDEPSMQQASHRIRSSSGQSRQRAAIGHEPAAIREEVIHRGYDRGRPRRRFGPRFRPR